VLAVALLAGFTTACGRGSPAEAYLQDAGALKRGKSIFIGTCTGYCHSTAPGPRDAPFLFDCRWRRGGSDSAVFATIADGVPATRMISFRGKLPEGDADIWRIVAFLKSARRSC
jgi:mono/diheme cytochrome c family protein